MKYERPADITSTEILGILHSQNATPSDRIKAVLCAIYYGETIEFSGDVLIKEFSEAKYKEKIYLKNLFETFYQMCRTTYRIDESIYLLDEYKLQSTENAHEIEDAIEALRELKNIFR